MKAKANESFINLLSIITTHKWHCELTLVIQNEIFNMVGLIDLRANINCNQEGFLPTEYYEKTTKKVSVVPVAPQWILNIDCQMQKYVKIRYLTLHPLD